MQHPIDSINKKIIFFIITFFSVSIKTVPSIETGLILTTKRFKPVEETVERDLVFIKENGFEVLKENS